MCIRDRQELAASNKKNSSKIFGSILTLKLLLALVAYTAIAIVADMIHLSPDVLRLVYLSGIYMALQSFVLVFPALFQAYESMQFSFIVRVGSNIVLSILVLSAIFFKLSVIGIFYAYIATAIIMFAVAIFLVKKYLFDIAFGINKIIIKYLLRQSWPLFFGNVCMTIYMSADTTMLSFMRNYKDVGIYQAAYKVLYVFLTLNLIHTALFPRMAELYQTNRVGLQKLLRFLISTSLAVLIPTIILIGIFRNQIVNLIYGSRFAGVGDVMLLLIIGGAISYFSGFFSNLLLIKKQQKQWFLALLCGLIANLVINYVAIPIYGPIGAGMSFVGGYIIVFTITILKKNSIN